MQCGEDMRPIVVSSATRGRNIIFRPVFGAKDANGQISLNTSSLVQHQGVNSFARLTRIHPVAKNPLSSLMSLGAFEPKLAKVGHVKKARPVACGQAFSCNLIKSNGPFKERSIHSKTVAI